MGLAVVQRIVRRHEGSIDIESEPDKGTSVRILLPCVKEAVSPAPKDEPLVARPRPALALGTVLVVEDESTLRFAVSTMLQRRGFTVVEAGDGTAALDLIRSRQNEFTVMLLDFTLPGASSRDVWEEARRLRPDLQVILTSAYGQEAVKAAMPGAETAEFIRKPFTIESLINLFQSCKATEGASGGR